MQAKLTRGFTLVEVLVAMAVLAIGGLATLQLLGVLINGNNNMGSVVEATALANRTIAEISDARLFSLTERDPGLVVDVSPYETRVNGSVIQTVGRFSPNNFTEVAADASPKYLVRYRVFDCPTCQTPTAGGAGVGGVEVVVEVDNFVDSFRRTGRTGALLQPIRMVIRKEATLSAAPAAQVRGFP